MDLRIIGIVLIEAIEYEETNGPVCCQHRFSR
jgi:hypothetical protein